LLLRLARGLIAVRISNLGQSDRSATLAAQGGQKLCDDPERSKCRRGNSELLLVVAKKRHTVARIAYPAGVAKSRGNGVSEKDAGTGKYDGKQQEQVCHVALLAM
jgi:hypothetical protein